MRVGQPRVEREQRHLDGEGHGERQEQPHLRLPRHGEVQPGLVVEAVRAGRHAVQVGHRQDGDQHQHAARHRVQDELHRRVDAPLVAPDPDQEVHRDEHRVPEHVEQEHVQGQEDADHRALEGEHEEGELPHLLVHRPPRPEQRQRREEAGEHDQEQADAVHADGVLDAERRDPVDALDHLEVGPRGVEPAPHPERERELDERHAQGSPLHEGVALVLAVADEQEQHRPGERQHDQRGEDGHYRHT